jgi:hypothetical protein
MKKSIIVSILLGVAIAGCKKDEEFPSEIRQVSSPTITFTGGRYYSINVGGALPTVAATAYDSVLNESYPVTIEGTDALDNTTPGLYIVSARSTNRNTYSRTENVYVAVTNIAANVDLSGDYKRVDVTTGDVSVVTKLARGLYSLDNIAGASRASRPDLLFPVLFVHSDDTTLLIPPQETPLSTTLLRVKDEYDRPNMAIIRRQPGDTSYKYAITAPSNYFGGALRKFKKQ